MQKCNMEIKYIKQKNKQITVQIQKLKSNTAREKILKTNLI